MQVNGTLSAALTLTDHVNISVRFCVYNVYKNKKVYPEITSVHDTCNTTIRVGPYGLLIS